MRTNIEKITNDLGPNYKDTDKEIIEEIYEEINSIASNISGLKKEDTRLLGTMYYAAPEQFGYGMSASSEKTDIYAVGVLLNVMLTGKIPKEEPVKGELWSVVERCICLEAKNRYTASELIEVLNGYLR